MKFRIFLEEFQKWDYVKGKHIPSKPSGDYKGSVVIPHDLDHPVFQKGYKVDLYIYSRPGEFKVELVSPRLKYMHVLDGYDNEKELRDDGWNF